MLSDEIQEKIAEVLVDRVEELNTTILEEIGKSIKLLGGLSKSEAYKLAQVMKYGGSSKKIIKKLAQITKLNVKDIRKILVGVAKNNLNFSKPFFKYRGIDFIPYEDNIALKRQVDSIAKLTSDRFLNIMNTSAYKTMKNGKAVFTPVSEIYQKTLDRAVIAISQGKETYQSMMRKTMSELAQNGIFCIDDFNVKKVEYASGYKRRADSAIRMNMLDGMRQLTNEMQQQLGKEFGSDGVEITVHGNPAPDHEDVQGRQFSSVRPSEEEKSEWEKLQDGENAVDYKGNTYCLDHDHKNGYRPISTMNCYHHIFSIILGVNEPLFSEERLQAIKDKNKKGFEFEGKKYTMYQGTQLQRAIESKIRAYKDRQIGAKARGDKKDVMFCQDKIRMLTNKYNDLCKVSGLSPKKQRLSVSGYRAVRMPKISSVSSPKVELNFDFDGYKKKFEKKGVTVDDSLKVIDGELLERNLQHLDYLTNKYNVTQNQKLGIGTTFHKKYVGVTYYRHNDINLNVDYFRDKKSYLEGEERNQRLKWHNPVEKENLDLYTMTHEFGHAIENDYTRKYIKDHYGIDTTIRQDSYSIKEDLYKNRLDYDIRDQIFDMVRESEGKKLNIVEITNKYLSDYGKSKTHAEWFAETFAQLELGKQNNITEAMKKWLERNGYGRK